MLFDGVYMCTFKPGNFTGWGSDGVKAGEKASRAARDGEFMERRV